MLNWNKPIKTKNSIPDPKQDIPRITSFTKMDLQVLIQKMSKDNSTDSI